MQNNNHQESPAFKEWAAQFGTIKEARALEYDEHNALSEILIKRVANNEYYLVLKLAFEDRQFLLVTTRSTAPRSFAHMHRLVDYLHTNFKNVKKIELSLNSL